MTVHPYMAYQLARSRQEELRQKAMRYPRRRSGRRQAPSSLRLSSWSLKAPLPRWAPAR